jgi:hypothetical protein
MEIDATGGGVELRGANEGVGSAGRAGGRMGTEAVVRAHPSDSPGIT